MSLKFFNLSDYAGHRTGDNHSPEQIMVQCRWLSRREIFNKLAPILLRIFSTAFFLKADLCLFNKASLSFFLWGSIGKNIILVKEMAWHRNGHKPSTGPMLILIVDSLWLCVSMHKNHHFRIVLGIFRVIRLNKKNILATGSFVTRHTCIAIFMPTLPN